MFHFITMFNKAEKDMRSIFRRFSKSEDSNNYVTNEILKHSNVNEIKTNINDINEVLEPLS